MSTRPPKLPTWASGAGDNVQPTNGEITSGWPASQTPPSRQRFNWFFNLVMNGIQYLVRRGISDWTSDEDYSIGDKSMGSDLKTYIAIQASTNKDPVSEPTYWAPWALTQDDADTRYALKNGEDTEIFEVADAVNSKDAVNLEVLETILNLAPTQQILSVNTATGNQSSTYNIPAGCKELFIAVNAAGGYGGGSGINGGGGGGGGGGAYLRLTLQGDLTGYSVEYFLQAVNSSTQAAVPAYGHHDADDRINNNPSLIKVFSPSGQEAIFYIGTGQTAEQGDGETPGGELSHGGRGGVGGVCAYLIAANSTTRYDVYSNQGAAGTDGQTNTGVGGVGGGQLLGADQVITTNPSSLGIGGVGGPGYNTVGVQGGLAYLNLKIRPAT